MEISQKVLHALNIQPHVLLTGLGTLSLVTKHAEYDVQNDKIRPPKKDLVFILDRGIKADNPFNGLSSQILKGLLEAGSYDLPDVGQWTNVAGKIDFVANPKAISDDFYGFEEITVPRVGTVEDTKTEAEDGNYKFNRAILWTFLIVLPIAGILYFVLSQQEKLFGKKSFNSVELSKIEKAPQPKVIDSTSLKLQDSIKKDTINHLPNHTTH